MKWPERNLQIVGWPAVRPTFLHQRQRWMNRTGWIGLCQPALLKMPFFSWVSRSTVGSIKVFHSLSQRQTWLWADFLVHYLLHQPFFVAVEILRSHVTGDLLSGCCSVASNGSALRAEVYLFDPTVLWWHVLSSRTEMNSLHFSNS